LIRTADGGVSVTVCRDKAGTEESLRVAREWIQQNAGHIKATPPPLLKAPSFFSWARRRYCRASFGR
jgi:hypothetical protein